MCVSGNQWMQVSMNMVIQQVHSCTGDHEHHMIRGGGGGATTLAIIRLSVD